MCILLQSKVTSSVMWTAKFLFLSHLLQHSWMHTESLNHLNPFSSITCKASRTLLAVRSELTALHSRKNSIKLHVKKQTLVSPSVAKTA